MTPYYDEDGITIYHGDCAEVLPGIDPASVDLVLTDPPYGLARLERMDFHKLTGSSEFNAAKGNYRGLEHSKIVGNDETFDPRPLAAFSRCVLFGPEHYYERLPGGGTFHVWDKREELASNMFADSEMIWTSFTSSPQRIFRYKWLGYMRRGEVGKHYHPTQKPVALMRWILDRWTEPGDLILDPYMGSGPVAQACHEMGRRYIGVEIVEDYCRIAVDRLRQGVLPLENAAIG